MTKVRRVVILSPRSRTVLRGTYLVVPISKSAPCPAQDHHCEFRPGAYHFFDPVESVWAKADMVTCVAWARLDRVKMNGRFTGAQIRKADLVSIKKAVLYAMGMELWEELETFIQVRKKLP